MYTPQGELLRIRRYGVIWVVELKSPVHGQWMVVDEASTYDAICQRCDEWCTGSIPR